MEQLSVFVPIYKALLVVPRVSGVWNFWYKIATLELFQSATREEFILWNRPLEHKSTEVHKEEFLS